MTRIFFATDVHGSEICWKKFINAGKFYEATVLAIATGSLAFLVPFVGKDRGFYMKHGSDVELIQMRPNISVAALLSGEIHYIELIGSAIRSAARGLPIRAISTGIRAPFFSIIGQNKYKSVKDLKGAVIGLTSIGGTNHISTRITLSKLGFDPDKDVKFLAIGELRRSCSTPSRPVAPTSSF